MNKICNKCFTVFHNEKDNDCKIYKCNGNLIDIDDALVPDMILLWNKGYKTISSCSGHPTEDDLLDSIYIEFDDICTNTWSLIEAIIKNFSNAKMEINLLEDTFKVTIDFYSYSQWLQNLECLHQTCIDVVPNTQSKLDASGKLFKEFYDSYGTIITPFNISISKNNRSFDDLYEILLSDSKYRNCLYTTR